ncbi:hypothetical protein B7759_01973 [Burkholderia glumae]|nr:transposase IS66 domain protein [Burkholderia glumae LMG 2196 = ATCC 33617]QKM55007.1 hypothetical protein CG017_03057 [Burkholderia glumae]QTP33381.1 hypothetical protein B7759_01973 [Burkholderia glumae]
MTSSRGDRSSDQHAGAARRRARKAERSILRCRLRQRTCRRDIPASWHGRPEQPRSRGVSRLPARTHRRRLGQPHQSTATAGRCIVAVAYCSRRTYHLAPRLAGVSPPEPGYGSGTRPDADRHTAAASEGSMRHRAHAYLNPPCRCLRIQFGRYAGFTRRSPPLQQLSAALMESFFRLASAERNIKRHLIGESRIAHACEFGIGITSRLLRVEPVL